MVQKGELQKRMSTIPQNEQECLQDALRRVNEWLNVLEGRITALLSNNNPEDMKPGEREQAACRHFTLMLRLLQLRQEYAQASPSPGEQALLDALLHSMDDE
jgi:hypothetical protein